MMSPWTGKHTTGLYRTYRRTCAPWHLSERTGVLMVERSHVAVGQQPACLQQWVFRPRATAAAPSRARTAPPLDTTMLLVYNKANVLISPHK